MSLHLRLIDRGSIVLVRALGEAVVEEWYELPDDPELAGLRPPAGLLVDLRPRRNLPTTTAVRELAQRLDRVTRRFSTVALVARPGAQYGLARMVEILGSVDDTEIQAFGESHVAISWLRVRLAARRRPARRD